MRHAIRPLALGLCLVALPAAGGGAGAATDAQHPAIAHYGSIHPRPDAAVQPDAHRQYKMVYDVVAAGDAGAVNPGLDHIARAVNVFASAGVPLDHLHFVAVIHGPATAAVLSDAAYGKQNDGAANPNTPLIAALEQAGVEVDVCAQALADHGFVDAQVDPDVTITLSALSTLAIYGNRGYAYEQF